MRINKRISDIEKDKNTKFILKDLDALLHESVEGMERIKKIVADLKTFSRSSKGVKEQANVNDVLEGILNIIWNEVKYKAELKKEYGEVPVIECDIQQIGQVFINILMNALDAMEGKGTISIVTYHKDKYVCVEISDTGKGMSSETKNRIFDAFFTTKETGKGTGLGLSISFEIIKKHNGEILVESEEGKGSKFIISLPKMPGGNETEKSGSRKLTQKERIKQ